MALAIIPARLASTRFPEKVLACETGQPLVQHVVERARRASRVDRVLVAADDPRIQAALAPFGTEVVMTSSSHPNGTSRIREAVAILARGGDAAASQPDAIVVNVQGDEPEIDPTAIDALIDALDRRDASTVPMATLASPFAEADDPSDPNLVKLLLRADATALSFSRAWPPTPHPEAEAEPADPAIPLRHIGAYAYRAHFLDSYARLSPTALERSERLEQLRALEHGFPIAVARVASAHHGIDTPEQYHAFVERHAHRDPAGPHDDRGAQAPAS